MFGLGPFQWPGSQSTNDDRSAWFFCAFSFPRAQFYVHPFSSRANSVQSNGAGLAFVPPRRIWRRKHEMPYVRGGLFV